MNTNKKNNDSESGWLRCPSKGNPGKYYYFNVVTGESVWSCDIDNKGLKENNVQKITDKCHNCHEPTDDGPTSSSNGPTFRPYYEPRSPYDQPMPIFGQATFPKYVPDQDLIPNIVWAPIQLPVFGQETKKTLIDQVTQTLDTTIDTEPPEIKLCEGCKCHKNPFLDFEANGIEKLFRTSTPKKNFIFKTFKETHLEHNIEEPLLPISPQKKINSNLLTSLSHGNKVENEINKEPKNEENILENLKSTDLRFLLIAKRRKSVDAGVNGPIEKKKILELKQPILKKRITFNMSNIEKVNENHTNLSDENNNKGLKENNVQKITDKCHNCHEPTDDGPTSSSNGPTFRPYYEPRSPYFQPMPIFGQATFPKYVPDQDLIPNIVWAPIQLPVFGQETKKTFIDKVTQTLETTIDTEPPEIKLCEGCKCYKNPFLDFEANGIEKPFRTSTPKKNFIFKTFKETHLEHNIEEPLLPISPQKKINSNLLTSLSHGNKVENEINKEPNNEENILENLKSTDLRFFLIAKRRKSVDAGVNGPIEKKKILELKQPILKKRVTFNVSNIEKVNENHTNLSDENNININQSYNINDYITKPELPKNESSIFTPKKIDKSKYLSEAVQSDTWFLVVDTDVLLLDYEIIDNIVLSDTKCKLLIPYAVRSDIEGLCIGDCQAQQRIKNARQITRRLVAPPQHYIVQPRPDDEDSLVTTDSVLKCCVQAATSNHRVILITNDPYLQAKSNLLNIKNYKLNDIKFNFNSNKPLDLKSLNIKHNNHLEDNHHESVVKENSLNSKVNTKSLPVRTKSYQPISKVKSSNSLFECENSVNIINKPKSVKIDETGTLVNISPVVKNLKVTDINLSNPVNPNQNPLMSKKINSNIPTNLFTTNSKKKFELTSKFKNVTTALVNDSCVTVKRTDEFEVLSLEDETFDRFTVKSEEMNEKLSSRMDEWICTYTQIMEDVLHALLQINSDCIRKSVAPLSLQETFHNIQMVFINNTKIKTIVKKLSNLLDKCTTKNGKLILAPDDFMTILGYGVLLVQELKTIQQHSKELKDAATSLHTLLNNIESDTSEDDPEQFKIAPVSRSEHDDQQEVRSNFVKDPSNVIDYLKKHYVQRAEFAGNVEDVNEKTTCRNDYNILRTSGKHLNKLKIFSRKNISLNTNEEINNTPKTIKLVNQISIEKQEIGQHLENAQKQFADTIAKPIRNKNTNLEIEKYERNQEQTKIKEIYNKSAEGPKFIRNINIMNEYEKKIRESLDLDALDYSEIENTHEYDEKSKSHDEINNRSVKNNNSDNKNESIYETSDVTSQNNGNTVNTCTESNKFMYLKDPKTNQSISKVHNTIPTVNDTIPKYNFIISKIYGNTRKVNNSIPNISSFYDNDSKNYQAVRDDNTIDSGFENDSTYAHSALKIFFSELCSTFRLVHQLIEKFRLVISKGDLCELKKKEFHFQASKSLEHFGAIIQHLKNIIKRESAEETVLKGLLLKAGLEASMDKRMTHYRQVAIKVLEQAQILEIGLNAIISVTIGDFGALSTIE